MAIVLMWITLIVVALVIVVIAVYLISFILALTAANRNLKQLAGGLELIVSHSEPLPQELATINGALVELLHGLQSVDAHLTGIVRVFKR
ncbi:MAG: hypothetical protein NVS3B14_06870 [Ktedonobacteraceae bacterium]